MLITPTNTAWRYFTDGTDPGAAWALPGFDDSSWPQGRGLFGNDTGYPYPFNTLFTRPSEGGPVTAYFRTTFNWSSHPSGVIFTMTNYFDDGVVIYLNGTELTRYNMPAGPVDQNTRAPGTLTEPVVRVHRISLDSLTNGNSNPLSVGTNVLAASVHNNAATSSDTVFGLSLFTGECMLICTDGIQPTNRSVLAGRSTTFTVVEQCALPVPAFQWYRNVGEGEELIGGATSNAYTLTNSRLTDEGRYYCRMTTSCGTVDSRQAVLDVFPCDCPPLFLSAWAVGPGLKMFRLTTDKELCGDFTACGGDYRSEFNWQIIQSDNTAVDLGVATVTKINPTTYEFTTQQPRDPARRYRITVHPEWGEISGLIGDPVPKGTFAETDWALFFQQGVGGYTGTQDAEIHSFAFADTPLGAATTMKADFDDGGVAQGLLRFENLFGSGPNRIPPGAHIRSATLTLNQVDPGSAINLHRMLVAWDQSITTWNNLVDGVTATDVEARRAIEATIPAGLPNGQIELDVTASVQAWANGELNYGWVLLSTGADGVTFNTSESGIPTAPFLIIQYSYIDECLALPVFIQHPPPSLSVVEGQTFTLSVVLSNALGVLQWTKNGVDIPGANQPSYTVQSATPLDAGTYRLSIRCRSGVTVAISNPSVVVIGDTLRPRLTWAVAESDGATITLRFSDPLNAASAQNLANYTFVPPLEMVGAVLSDGNSSVTLTTEPREFPIHYTLRIADLANNSASPNLIDPNPTFVSLSSTRVILPWNADGWQYNTTNLDATPDWKTPNFTLGSDWNTGAGLFGVETGAALTAAPAPIATPLTPNSVAADSERRVTTYFRRTINLPALPDGARYVIGHYTDDGFIAYLDSAEIHRFGMPAGAVTFTNRSTGIPTGDATYRSFTFNAAPGPHTLAVELHQAGLTSSDVLFGMEVRMLDGPSPSLSVSHTVDGGVNFNWNADTNWRLRRSTAVTGPYLDVDIPAGSRFGTFTQPGASTVNGMSFYLLDYVCRP
jgi:hypothetical protein